VEVIRDFLTVTSDLPLNIEQVLCFAFFVFVFYKISSYKIYW